MVNALLWLPKLLLLSHFEVWVSLTTPQPRYGEVDARCARMRERLFRKK